MRLSRVGILAIALALAAGPALAAGVGSQLPAPELEGFTQTKAKSFDDFVGRTLLIEFFAYT